MHRVIRWTAAFGAAVLIPLAPVATATAASGPAASAPAARTATPDRLVEVPAAEAFEQAVDPSECGVTLLDGYFTQQLGAMTDEQFAFLVAHQNTLLSVPPYDALFVGPEAGFSEHELAAARGIPAGQLYGNLQKANRLPELERAITEEKAFAQLLSQSTIEEVKS